MFVRFPGSSVDVRVIFTVDRPLSNTPFGLLLDAGDARQGGG
jgi:hypothetical protein